MSKQWGLVKNTTQLHERFGIANLLIASWVTAKILKHLRLQIAISIPQPEEPFTSSSQGVECAIADEFKRSKLKSAEIHCDAQFGGDLIGVSLNPLGIQASSGYLTLRLRRILLKEMLAQ
jgi:hypothetical protein